MSQENEEPQIEKSNGANDIVTIIISEDEDGLKEEFPPNDVQSSSQRISEDEDGLKEEFPLNDVQSSSQRISEDKVLLKEKCTPNDVGSSSDRISEDEEKLRSDDEEEWAPDDDEELPPDDEEFTPDDVGSSSHCDSFNNHGNGVERKDNFKKKEGKDDPFTLCLVDEVGGVLETYIRVNDKMVPVKGTQPAPAPPPQKKRIGRPPKPKIVPHRALLKKKLSKIIRYGPSLRI